MLITVQGSEFKVQWLLVCSKSEHMNLTFYEFITIKEK